MANTGLVTLVVGQTVTFGSIVVGTPVSLTVGAADYYNESIPSGTNTGIIWPFPTSGLSVFMALASTAMTLKINSSGSPDETITLAANVPYLWYNGCGFSNPFSNAVTEIYVTNAATGTLQMIAGFTP